MKEKGIGMETFLSGTVSASIGARTTERSRSGKLLLASSPVSGQCACLEGFPGKLLTN